MIRLATEIRSYKPQIEEANARTEQLLNERAILVKRLYDQGLRYKELEPLVGMNPGSVLAALNRARRLENEQALARADDLVNERTNHHAP